MYLLNYDFYDLHALITFFRNNTAGFSRYKSSIEQIVQYIKAPAANGIEPNTIRKILRPYFDDNDDALSWVLVNNAYTANISIIKTEAYYLILSSVFEEMIKFYSNEQRLYLLCDASYNIPLILADIIKPEKAIKEMVSDYRKQYNKNFLVNELKSI